MIDSKIILAENLLKQKRVDYDHEKIDDISVVFFLFLPKDTTIEYLIQIWTVVDDLDFRTFNGCTTKVDVYEEKGIGVIELSVQEKKSSFFGLLPARVAPPTTPQLPAPRPVVSIDPLKDYLVSDFEYTQSTTKLTRREMTGDELADIEEFVQINFYGYEGPFSTFKDLQDSIYFNIIEPIDKTLRIEPRPGDPPVYPNTIKITIDKFSREIFFLTEVRNFDRGTKRRHFKCQGLDELESLFMNLGYYN